MGRWRGGEERGHEEAVLLHVKADEDVKRLHHGQKAAIKLGRDVGTLENLWQLAALNDGAAIGRLYPGVDNTGKDVEQPLGVQKVQVTDANQV